MTADTVLYDLLRAAGVELAAVVDVRDEFGNPVAADPDGHEELRAHRATSLV